MKKSQILLNAVEKAIKAEPQHFTYSWTSLQMSKQLSHFKNAYTLLVDETPKQAKAKKKEGSTTMTLCLLSVTNGVLSVL